MARERKKLPEKVSKTIQNIAAFLTACGVIIATVSAVVGQIQENATASLRSDIEQLSNDVASIKLDTTRMQLMTLINEDPDNVTDILKVAKYYFKDLHGDWYMSGMFADWAEKHNIDVSHLVQLSNS